MPDPTQSDIAVDYPHAESISIDLRLHALGYVIERVKASYGPDAIALRNVAQLVDGVADAVANDDRLDALVRGTRLLDEIEVAELWRKLGGGT